MKLFTKAQEKKLLANGANQRADRDPKPVVKLFNPVGAGTWLLTEIDPENPNIAFGLCDLGFGCPELGSVDLNELSSIRLRFGLKIERDLSFTADKPLSEYTDEAVSKGRIVA